MQAVFEYFSTNLWQFWVIAALLCLILELFSGDFFIMCFSIGAVVTAVASVFDIGIYAQLVIFAIVSVLCLFFVRPFALKYLHSGDERPSNAEALIGRVGRVSTTIEANGYGRVAVDGDDWKACSVNGDAIPQGSKVRIVSMDSIIISVELI